jgi:hypothetical protein
MLYVSKILSGLLEAALEFRRVNFLVIFLSTRNPSHFGILDPA